MPRKTKRVLVASANVLTRLQAFQNELRELCRRYDFALFPAVDQIEVIDKTDTRPRRLKADWPAEAYADTPVCKTIRFALREYDLSDDETVQHLTKAGILPKHEAKQ